MQCNTCGTEIDLSEAELNSRISIDNYQGACLETYTIVGTCLCPLCGFSSTQEIEKFEGEIHIDYELGVDYEKELQERDNTDWLGLPPR